MILLIGSEGSIGKRYQAILRHLSIEYQCFDPVLGQMEPDWNDVDKVLIASPTDTHYYWCQRSLDKGIPFLCEKPVSKNVEEVSAIASRCKLTGIDGRMVCNYKFVLGRKKPIVDDYFRTGGDGVYWDLIQLLYLNPELKFYTKCPIWTLITEHDVIRYGNLENSYVAMIISWVGGHNDHLWNMEDAAKATEVVIERMKKDDHTDNR